jgi:phenylalanyl-tRNA synthetase beta chain
VIGGEPDPWTRPGSAEDRFLELKGAIEALLKAFGIDSPHTRSYHETCWEHGSAVRIEAGGAVLAWIGEVAAELRETARVDRRLWAAALDVAALERAAPTRKQYQAIHRYPATKRDLAIVVAREVPHSDLLEAIRSGGAPLLHEARLFDVFEGAQVGHGKKSLAFALEFRAADRTLSDREADEALGRVVNELAARFGAVWRGGKAAPAPAGLPAE